MVAPFPDKPAAGAVILLYGLKIIFQIPGAVAHGMADFAHHIGLRPILLKIVMNLLKGRIHTAVYVNIAVIVFALVGHIPGALKMSQTGRVKFLCPS